MINSITICAVVYFITDLISERYVRNIKHTHIYERTLEYLEDFVDSSRQIHKSVIPEKDIYAISKQIYKSMFPEDKDLSNPIYLLVCIVSYLYNITDRLNQSDKYKQKLSDFFELLRNENFCDSNIDADKIMRIINNISPAQEEKVGTANWYSELGSIGLLVRDIVSDANKLATIGNDGLARCREHIIEKYTEENMYEPSEIYVLENIVTHYTKYLKNLSEKYIITESGKYMAEELNNEMAQRIKAINKEIIKLRKYELYESDKDNKHNEDEIPDLEESDLEESDLEESDPEEPKSVVTGNDTTEHDETEHDTTEHDETEHDTTEHGAIAEHDTNRAYSLR